MTIALILQGIALCALGFVVGSQVMDISSLKKHAHEMTYNRNHISRQEQGVIEGVGRTNRKLIEQLAKEMGKKVEPADWGFDMQPPSYKLVDLTEKEKKADKLRKELEELEESGD